MIVIVVYYWILMLLKRQIHQTHTYMILKLSVVSTLFDLWSLGDKLSRIYPYKLTGAYSMNYSGTFQVH